jgi:hypothetical protein
MTIKYRQTSYGRRVEGEPKSVPVGTETYLVADPRNLDWSLAPITVKLRVDSPDQVTITRRERERAFSSTYRRGEINRRNIQRDPLMGSLKDVALWRRRHYFWEEDK